MNEPRYISRLYGRRQDKPLKKRQASLMKTLLPLVKTPELNGGPIDPAKLFPEADEAWLEIGFGGGEHIAWQAAQHKRVGLIGAEPFVNGVAKLLVRIDDEKLDNIRIHFGDARPLMEALPAASLMRIYVLHPDPWPKKRHHKRRVVSPWFFNEAARLLRTGGVLRVSSDIPDYIRWTLMHAQNAPDFTWTAEKSSDWRTAPADWPETRYEAKARRVGRTPAYLQFQRR